jgi:predicted ABC-type ATPase
MPYVIVIAGPNGAGKSTAAPALLHGLLGLEDFVNADVIARGLSAFHPEGAALQAGRIMLARVRELAAAGRDFAFETTLASRTFAPWIAGLRRDDGYEFHLNYLWVPAPELSIARVANRVREGGHFVPDDDVRRRYQRGLDNFFQLYRPIAEVWRFYDNSQPSEPRLLAEKSLNLAEALYDEDLWNRLEGGVQGEERQR